jgi:hypothetical protein
MLAGLAAAVCAVVVATATNTTAAPVPKDAGKADPTPDLKRFFDAAGKAVESEKWPEEKDEKMLRDTTRVIFERATKAAEQKDRKLPVDFENLTKVDMAKEYRQPLLENGFVITGDARVTSAKNSVIFATGDVQITSATNCVIVAKNVRCTVVDNCVVVAGDYIRVTGARPREKDGPGSVLVAGQWIRATGLDSTICHVIRPGKLPPPDNKGVTTDQPAIRTNSAKGVIYLNERSDTSGRDPDQQTYSPPKNPIAK